MQNIINNFFEITKIQSFQKKEKKILKRIFFSAILQKFYQLKKYSRWKINIQRIFAIDDLDNGIRLENNDDLRLALDIFIGLRVEIEVKLGKPKSDTESSSSDDDSDETADDDSNSDGVEEDDDQVGAKMILFF